MTPETLPETGDEPKRSRAARAQSGPAAQFGPTAPLLALPTTFAVDMSFVSDAEIAQLNREYRHKNKPTDVLSFSQWEEEAPSDASDATFGGADDETPFSGAFFAAPEGEALPLGDLVISIETAQRQAAELGHSLPQEIEFLAVHGTLHLLGYDHIRDSDRRVMWQWQEAIVEGMRAEG